MKERPESLTDEDVRVGLADGWEIAPTAMRYVPLGGGSYHWDVATADGSRWFVSATDLDRAPWLGTDRASSLVTLKTTMNAARALQRRVGCSFVLAPIPSAGGDVVRVVRERYGAVVHPFVEGSCGDFGARLHGSQLSAAVDIVAALHASPTSSVELHELVELEARKALAPTSECAAILDRYDTLAARVAGRPRVITHGEPHAGNLMTADRLTYLIDWDTAALALPERDLWLLHDHGNQEVVSLYEARTGYSADPGALAFYRLRWRIEELIGAVQDGEPAAIRGALNAAEAAAGFE